MNNHLRDGNPEQRTELPRFLLRNRVFNRKNRLHVLDSLWIQQIPRSFSCKHTKTYKLWTYKSQQSQIENLAAYALKLKKQIQEHESDETIKHN